MCGLRGETRPGRDKGSRRQRAGERDQVREISGIRGILTSEFLFQEPDTEATEEVDGLGTWGGRNCPRSAVWGELFEPTNLSGCPARRFRRLVGDKQHTATGRELPFK